MRKTNLTGTWPIWKGIDMLHPPECNGCYMTKKWPNRKYYCEIVNYGLVQYIKNNCPCFDCLVKPICDMSWQQRLECKVMENAGNSDKEK